MTKFLIQDWTDEKLEIVVIPKRDRHRPESKVAESVSELLDEINNAMLNKRRIAVYEVGECLLDWS